MPKADEEPQHIDETLDSALKRLLKGRGTSLRRLAETLERDVGFLSRAVRGAGGKNASAQLLSEMAAALNVPPEWFAPVREARVIAAIKADPMLRDRLFREVAGDRMLHRR